MMIQQISVEGNIGSQKKIVLDFLEQHFSCSIVQYNQKDSTKELLKQFLKDPKRWAFALECDMLSNKIKQNQKENQNHHQNHHQNQKQRQFRSGSGDSEEEEEEGTERTPPQVVFTNRSYESDLECFMKSFLHLKYMTKKEYMILLDLYTSFFQKNQETTRKHKIIYLHSDVNRCYERIIQEPMGNYIDFEYIEALDKQYEEWMKTVEHIRINISDYPDLNTNEKSKNSLCKRLMKEYPFLQRIQTYDFDQWITVTKKIKGKSKAKGKGKGKHGKKKKNKGNHHC